jgi:chemotaxis signal transduction protein
LKGLKFKQGDFHFIVEVKYVLHVASKSDVEDDLREIKSVNFQKLLNTGSESEEVIFLGRDDNIVAMIVEKVIEVSEIGEVFPFEKDIFVIEFIKGMVKYNGIIYYLIDFEKITEVDYEEESPSNR